MTLPAGLIWKNTLISLEEQHVFALLIQLAVDKEPATALSPDAFFGIAPMCWR
jgi:hypothetical protein